MSRRVGSVTRAVVVSPADAPHRTLRQCERHLREVYPDCARIPEGWVACACGRRFAHVHGAEPGPCYWALRGDRPWPADVGGAA